MLGDSTALGGGGGSSGDAVAAVAAAAASAAVGGAGTQDGAESAVAAEAGGGGVGSNSGEDDRGRGGEEGGDRSFGGNRWPRQETLALLKIRSDMDVAFRDASVKGPLWEEVSRKLAELGYHRSAKKCKEKFENVYKYHKRTKEGRSGKSDGKTYRFFDQLEALDHHYYHHQNHPSIQSPPPPQPPPSSKPPMAAPPVANPPAPPNVTVPSTIALPMAMPQGIVNVTSIPPYPPTNPTIFPVPSSTANPIINPPQPSFPSSFTSIPTDLLSNSSSSSTSSDETLEGRRKRKRKWKDFFERLMKEVIEKQEELQKRFLEAIEKREHERMVREEAWRMQEMTRINKEREILAQERSIAAAKDAAVMAFLQKIAEQQNLGSALNNINMIPQPQLAPQPPPPPPVQQAVPVSVAVQVPVSVPVTVTSPRPQQTVMSLQASAPQQQLPQQQVTNMEIIIKSDNNGENLMMTPSSSSTSSRWPRVEVQALIKLRTNMDSKYQENGPKGPLWEEISAAMRRLGYNRSSKRCKEKWENINKYFKKVKESNKKRPEDSKTCPYFHQLDALYRERNNNKLEININPSSSSENMMAAPLMVQPEQQWPPQQDTRSGPDVTMEEAQNDHEEEDEDDEDKDRIREEEEEEDEEEEGGSSNYEIVASKPAASVGASE